MCFRRHATLIRIMREDAFKSTEVGLYAEITRLDRVDSESRQVKSLFLHKESSLSSLSSLFPKGVT